MTRRDSGQLHLPRLQLTCSTGVVQRCWARWLLVASAVLLLAACTANASPPKAASASPTATLTATWQALEQRPLNLPSVAPGAACPKTSGHQVSTDFGSVLGDGPAYPFLGMGSAIGVMQASVLVPVQWYIASSYTGPVLVRGRQLDGLGVLTFEGGLDQLDYRGEWRDAPHLQDLRLMGGKTFGSPWATFATHTNVPGDGCYAYQVDGTTFSYSLIFMAEEIEY